MDNFNSFMSVHVANMPQHMRDEMSLAIGKDTLSATMRMLDVTTDEASALVDAALRKSGEISEKSPISIRDAFGYIAKNAVAQKAIGIDINLIIDSIDKMDSIDDDDMLKQRMIEQFITSTAT